MNSCELNDGSENLEHGLQRLGRVTRTLAAALGYRDMLTRLHSERVNSLAEALGVHCGLPDSEIRALGIAAAFHDVGKIGVPDSILQKPTPFDAQEWERMKRHSVIGEDLLLATDIEGIAPIAKVVRHHHEWFGGSGYPDGLRGAEIPLAARIISVVDAYDAMAVTRPYHRARDHDEVMKVLDQEAGTKFDPELVSMLGAVLEHSDLRASQSGA